MAQANLAHAGVSIETSQDSVIIVDNFQSIRGGFTLDVTGFTPTVIYAGHPIIEETATGQLKPMPISSPTAFAALPTGHTYAGIAINSTFTDKPMKGIMVRGTVNHIAFKNGVGYDYAPILTAVKAALPNVDFRGDR